MSDGTSRDRWLPAFLWVSVTAWAIGFGAKLFELAVLIPAWAAHPPESLSLLPYGPRWPIDPGEFFQPLSALLLVGVAGALVAGWRTAWTFKRWLWLSLGILAAVWVITPTLFWPMIEGLYYASTGKRPLSPEAAVAMAQRWILLDWIREALIAAGFFVSLRAITLRYRNSDT